jgi:Flp pilus assembly protein TadG
MPDMKKRTLLHSCQRGVAAVEFALLLTPLILMIFGTTELGRAIYSYNTLDQTVRDASRHLSQHGPGDAIIAAEAKCLAVHGTTDCSGSPVAPGLTTGMVTICDASLCPTTHSNQLTGLGSINLVTVGIQNYAFDSVVEFVIPAMTFNNISSTLRAQL